MNISLPKNNTQTPKYKQIIESVEEAIKKGVLKKGDKLPSLNKIKSDNSLSRDTVLTAFNELKNRGIIHSVVGKGYFVTTEDIEVRQKVFVLFDELNSFKEDLYNSLLNAFGNEIQVDVFFHHFNIDHFSKLIKDNNGKYSFYIIMPANLANTSLAIQNLPKGKVFILDQTHNDLEDYPAIYQNFEEDIYNGLKECLLKIVNYKKLILLFSEKQPKGILDGFLTFSNQFNINCEVVMSIKNKDVEEGEVYLVLDDKDLIRIIKKAKAKDLVLSKSLGIISFNDTILKEVVENGITTISTDFTFMGKRLAEMILNNEQIRIENPSKLILRKSL